MMHTSSSPQHQGYNDLKSIHLEALNKLKCNINGRGGWIFTEKQKGPMNKQLDPPI
jgi:hypothetical protein